MSLKDIYDFVTPLIFCGLSIALAVLLLVDFVYWFVMFINDEYDVEKMPTAQMCKKWAEDYNHPIRYPMICLFFFVAMVVHLLWFIVYPVLGVVGIAFLMRRLIRTKKNADLLSEKVKTLEDEVQQLRNR